MPRIKLNLQWTQNQREIKKRLDGGESEEQLEEEGYGKDSIRLVKNALAKGWRPTESEPDPNPPPSLEPETGTAIEDKDVTKKKAGSSKGDGAKADKETKVLSQAQQIKFVPRVYTADYTPIMRAGQAAAIREWGWREDMPLENFLDTIINIAFKDRGIILAGYIVEKEEVQGDGS